jgi:hypothetical protein
LASFFAEFSQVLPSPRDVMPKLWPALIEMGPPEHSLAFIISSQIETLMYCSEGNNKLEEFVKEEGVMQGHVPYPIPFNLYGKYNMRQVLKGQDNGVSNGQRKVSICR